jgi:hypothetical protein
MQDNKPPLNTRFEHFSASPSPEVWNRIEAELEKKTNRRSAFFWWSAAFICFLAIGSTAYFIPIDTNKNAHSPSTTAANDKNLSNKTKIKSTQTQNPQAKKSTNKQNIIRKKIANQNKYFFPLTAATTRKSDITIEKSIQNFEFKLLATESNSLSPEHIESKKKIQPINQKETHSDSAITNNTNFDKIEEIREPKIVESKTKSNWSISPSFGFYSTNQNVVPNSLLSFTNTDLNAGLGLNNSIEALQINESASYRQTIHSFGLDLAYQFLPRWQIRGGTHLLMYKTIMSSEQPNIKGANYYQLTIGGDYKLLHFKKITWHIGTGLGYGLLRNPIPSGIQNSLRAEWNINSLISFQITNRIAIRLQPTARLVISDSQFGGFGKLSRWYNGANIGATFQF